MRQSPERADGARRSEKSFLAEVRPRMAALRREIPRFTRLGEAMAEPLLAGGALCVPPVAKFWRSEFSGRAGGLMGIRWDEGLRSAKDVAFFALPDPRRWQPEKDEVFQRQLNSKRRLFAIGRPEDLDRADWRRRIAGFTGGARPAEGLCGMSGYRPLAPFQPFEQLVRGWMTGGELIAACTRAGKMPAIWMSVWFEGAFARNTSMIDHQSNRREPWFPPLLHKEFYVPPLPAGHIASEFLRNVEQMAETLQGQARRLARAGRWMAEAHRAGRKIHTVAVGHSYPEILELPEPNPYPIRWGRTDSNLLRSVPKDLGRGDVFIHLGYSPVDVRQVRTILRRGIRFVYTSPYGRPADLGDAPNLLWLDLPWPPGDACVNVPGYSVRILPLSSASHTLAYFSMLTEMSEAMGWI